MLWYWYGLGVWPFYCYLNLTLAQTLSREVVDVEVRGIIINMHYDYIALTRFQIWNFLKNYLWHIYDVPRIMDNGIRHIRQNIWSEQKYLSKMLLGQKIQGVDVKK